MLPSSDSTMVLCSDLRSLSRSLSESLSCDVKAHTGNWSRTDGGGGETHPNTYALQMKLRVNNNIPGSLLVEDKDGCMCCREITVDPQAGGVG
jgi:hypothetical protein